MKNKKAWYVFAVASIAIGTFLIFGGNNSVEAKIFGTLFNLLAGYILGLNARSKN